MGRPAARGHTGAMWSDRRAEAALRELEALDGAGLDVTEVHATALDVVATVVPFDGACVGAVDPDTLLLTSGVTVGFEPSAAETARFVEIELGGLDRRSFADLAAANIAVLADGAAPGAAPVAPQRRRDLRFNELNRLIGFRHETRLAFLAGGACWAVGDLYRADAGRGFEARELSFLEAAAPRVGAATRSAIRAPAEVAPGGATLGAAVLMIDGNGRPVGITEAARRWVTELDPPSLDRLEWAVRTAATLARRGMPSASTRLRVRGTWVAVHASRLEMGADRSSVAVAIEPASAEQVTDLLIAAHGLSQRERDVCRAVLAGRSTREIAGDLFIAQHTVQDHLKSIFAKVGVGSRRELVAVLG